jgi:putative hydrolase of the HAD superfamily
MFVASGMVLEGGELALRAVVFDYGMVLSGVPDAAAHATLVRIAGLPEAEFEDRYWRDRHAYDEGKLTGLEFWRKFDRDAGLGLSPVAIDELNRWDGLMWTTKNDAMLAWNERLKQHGLLTAILSNMGDNVLASIERTFTWPERFDVRVWSFEHKMAKPEPAIYRIVLDQLGTRAEETLFLDDRQVNIDAAVALGMVGIHFSTVESLRAELIARGLDAELPLP